MQRVSENFFKIYHTDAAVKRGLAMLAGLLERAKLKADLNTFTLIQEQQLLNLRAGKPAFGPLTAEELQQFLQRLDPLVVVNVANQPKEIPVQDNLIQHRQYLIFAITFNTL